MQVNALNSFSFRSFSRHAQNDNSSPKAYPYFFPFKIGLKRVGKWEHDNFSRAKIQIVQYFFSFSYAGLHCVVIKGYSKSAGYQPGVCFEDNRFRNSWNAVYVAGAWRFVQCNWGARHLVNAKEVPRPGQPKAKNDSLR